MANTSLNDVLTDGGQTLSFSKKRRVKFFYDSSAGVYNKRYQEIQMIKYTILLRKTHEIRSLVVDVGCGTGLFCELLTMRGFRVVGIDFSIEMLRRAKKAITLQKVFLVCCDSDFLPLRDNIFCGAFSVTLLQNLPNPMLSLNEIVRVCKKGSMVHLSVLSKSLNVKDLEILLSQAGLRDIEVFGSLGSEDIYGHGKI